MKTVIIIGDAIFFPVVRYYITEQQDVLLITSEKKIPKSLSGIKNITTLFSGDLLAEDLFKGLDLDAGTRVILCFPRNDMLAACHEALRSVNKAVPAILIGLNRRKFTEIDTPYNTALFSVERLVQQQLESQWSTIENRSRLEQLRAINQTCENILILIQHDPDPDALASGLALRVLLGRNKLTAPIATFGSVTRSENQNMSRLLDIPVLQVTAEDLHTYSKIALVDVQPPYFKNGRIQADIVFDHHPVSEPYNAEFTDIRVSCGSTSTILGKYLIDGGYKISQRLATALTYGIKSDTMSLERDISDSDIDVFTSLYPLANLNMLRQIEHAMLAYHEIGSFIKALKNMVVVDKMLFVWLGTVKNEDIIPRIADFCLQIVGSEWAFVTGIHKKEISCSVRNVGYVKHAGELIQQVFSDLGSAGGHRSMAKAVMPLSAMKKHFEVRRASDLAHCIMQAIINSIEK
jgi:nanoRNase/pAp phosphatase (c-di-AMP/oligoRNAs hydrolase)